MTTGSGMNFAVYQRQTQRSPQRPWVSLLAAGDISITHSGLALLGHPAKVDLLYDATVRLFAVRASEDETTAFRVGKGKGSGRVATRSVLPHFGITERSVRYEARLVDEMLVIDLNGPSTPIRRKAKANA